MVNWLLICVLATLAAFPVIYSHPRDAKVFTVDDDDDHHEVEEMSPEEQLEVVESTMMEHVIPAPPAPTLFEDGDAEAVIPPEQKLRTGKYTLHKSRRNWAEATEYCRNDNLHLVRLETSLELRTVLAHFTDGVTQVWTDGIGDLQGKKYLWATTGNTVDVDELETLKDNEDVFPKALLLERKGLVGEIQTNRLPFICES